MHFRWRRDVGRKTATSVLATDRVTHRRTCTDERYRLLINEFPIRVLDRSIRAYLLGMRSDLWVKFNIPPCCSINIRLKAASTCRLRIVKQQTRVTEMSWRACFNAQFSPSLSFFFFCCISRVYEGSLMVRFDALFWERNRLITEEKALLRERD